ncbi:lipase [Elysia marginata]|uniref:Lipase n=1 Tax=Elysia marginata TaxID=1093978 RepID=A0AAV4IMC5_9GAST|nr:lipase [Elysia marginata]
MPRGIASNGEVSYSVTNLDSASTMLMAVYVYEEEALIKSGEFQNFDEGSPKDNMKRYGQESPPLYDLTSYSVPTTIFYGGHDNFIQETDIMWLSNQTHADELVYVPQFEHQDFVWGIDAVVHVYRHIVDTIFKG